MPNPTAPDMEKLVARFRELLATVQEGGRRLPWHLWTSCSYRRIKTGPLLGHRDDGKDVLSGYRCADGVVDLSMPEPQLKALVEIVNALPSLLSTLAKPAALPKGEGVEELVLGLRDTARWIQSRDPLATNYLYCIQAADALSQAGQGVEERAWAWLDRKFGAPEDQSYDADQMVDAYIAGAALSHPAPSGEWEGVAFTPSDEELEAIRKIGAEQELSDAAVMRQALRHYQLLHVRLRAGETFHFSGDADRAAEFAGLATLPPPGEADRVDMGEVERIRREAFEEAARVADAYLCCTFSGDLKMGADTAAKSIAKTILALPSTPKQEG